MLLLPFVGQASYLTNLIEKQNSDSVKINCIQLMFNNYINHMFDITRKFIYVEVHQNVNIYQDEILELFHRENTIIVSDSINKNFKIKHFLLMSKMNMFIVFFSRTSDIEQIIKNWMTSGSWNAMASVLVILEPTMESIDDTESYVYSILREFLKHNIVDVNVLIEFDDTKNMKLLTWLPYGNGNCGHFIDSLQTISQCNYLITENNMTFVNFEQFNISKKLPAKLNRCTLSILFFIWEPYSFFNKNNELSGTDVELIKTIANVMNMKVEFSLDNRLRDNSVVPLELLNRFLWFYLICLILKKKKSSILIVKKIF